MQGIYSVLIPVLSNPDIHLEPLNQGLNPRTDISCFVTSGKWPNLSAASVLHGHLSIRVAVCKVLKHA